MPETVDIHCKQTVYEWIISSRNFYEPNLPEIKTNFSNIMVLTIIL